MRGAQNMVPYFWYQQAVAENHRLAKIVKELEGKKVDTTEIDALRKEVADLKDRQKRMVLRKKPSPRSK